MGKTTVAATIGRNRQDPPGMHRNAPLVVRRQQEHGLVAQHEGGSGAEEVRGNTGPRRRHRPGARFERLVLVHPQGHKIAIKSGTPQSRRGCVLPAIRVQ